MDIRSTGTLRVTGQCAACGVDRNDAYRELCFKCYGRMPQETRLAYMRERRAITTRQAVDCLRTRMASCKVFGGGQRR